VVVSTAGNAIAGMAIGGIVSVATGRGALDGAGVGVTCAMLFDAPPSIIVPKTPVRQAKRRATVRLEQQKSFGETHKLIHVLQSEVVA
jgi:hypothetical protein